MRNLRGWLLLWVLLGASPAFAVIETYDFDNDELLARYQLLSAELRCPKCQNQNIADSNAPIAEDLRAQLHRQLQAGKSDEAIVDYMVKRYGEFVLYRPRWNNVTMLLWLAPVIFLVLALWILVASLRRKSASPAAQSVLSDEEKTRLNTILGGEKQRD